MLTGDCCVFHPCVREGLVTVSLSWTELLSQMPAALLDLDLLTDNCHLKPYLLFCQQTLPAVA